MGDAADDLEHDELRRLYKRDKCPRCGSKHVDIVGCLRCHWPAMTPAEEEAYARVAAKSIELREAQRDKEHLR